jgi:hypothetical protein
MNNLNYINFIFKFFFNFRDNVAHTASNNEISFQVLSKISELLFKKFAKTIPVFPVIGKMLF